MQGTKTKGITKERYRVMKRQNQLAAMAVTLIVAASTWALFSQPASAQVTVLDDTFTANNSGTVSTLDATAPNEVGQGPTYTDYQVLATKSTTNSPGVGSALSVTPGDLHLTFTGTTTSGALEFEALFTDNPVTLVNNGDYVQLAITFTDSNGWAAGGGGNNVSTLFQGLYNANQVGPLAGGPLSGSVPSGTLSGSAPSPYATNGAALWNGYVGTLNVGGCSQINLRPAQTNTAPSYSASQETLMNGAFSGAYNLPKGLTLHSLNTSQSLTAYTDGQQYTDVIMAQLQSSGVLNVTNNLFLGAGTNGTLLIGNGNVINVSTQLLTQTFDAMAFGLYEKSESPATNPVIDVSQVVVTSDIPEPSTYVLLGGSLALLMGSLVHRRRSS